MAMKDTIKITAIVSEDLMYRCALRAMKDGKKDPDKSDIITEAMKNYVDEQQSD